MNNLFNNIETEQQQEEANRKLCKIVSEYIDTHKHSMYASDNIRKLCRVCNPERNKETYFEFLIKKLKKS